MDSKTGKPYFLESVEPTVKQLITLAEHCGLELSSSLSDELAERNSLIGEAVIAEEIGNTGNLNVFDKGLGFAVDNTAFLLLNKANSNVKRSDYRMSESEKADLTAKISADTGVSILFGQAVTVTVRQLAEMVKAVGLEFKSFDDHIANTRLTISTHPSTPFRSMSGKEYQLFAIERSNKFTKHSIIAL